MIINDNKYKVVINVKTLPFVKDAKNKIMQEKSLVKAELLYEYYLDKAEQLLNDDEISFDDYKKIDDLLFSYYSEKL